MAEIGTNVDEDLQLLDIRLKQLKNEYEQYFLGTRPREPQMLRGEVQKIISVWANLPIQNTGYRFKFNNLRARFFAFRRHWDMTVRKIEEGTYERHLFKAKLHARDRRGPPSRRKPTSAASEANLFDSYLEARQACGQGTKELTREKLDALIAKQTAAIQAKHDCKKVKFRVVVENGKAKLKATAVKSA